MKLVTRADVPLLVRWEQERPYPWTADHFFETISSETVKTFLFEFNGRPVGFVVAQMAGGEVYLQNLLVEPIHRRQGFGFSMLDQMVCWAREKCASAVTLDVDSANGPALELYRKFGFEVMEHRKKSYPRGEDAVVLRKLL